MLMLMFWGRQSREDTGGGVQACSFASNTPWSTSQAVNKSSRVAYCHKVERGVKGEKKNR